MSTTIAHQSSGAKRSAAFVRLHREGLSYSQIAEKFGVTRNAVAGAIYRNTKPQQAREYEKARTADDRALSRKRRAAAYRALLEACEPQDERDALIVDLLARGLIPSQIADHLGLTRQAVSLRVLKMSGGFSFYRFLRSAA